MMMMSHLVTTKQIIWVVQENVKIREKKQGVRVVKNQKKTKREIRQGREKTRGNGKNKQY